MSTRFERGRITSRTGFSWSDSSRRSSTQGSFLREHLRRNLFEHAASRDLERQGGDDHRGVFHLVPGPHAHAARSACIEGEQLVLRGDDLRSSGIVGAENVSAELFERAVGLFQEADARIGHFTGIVGRKVGCHAHGDSGGAVQQRVRQARRKDSGLVHGAVEIGEPLHRALSQFGEQGIRESREPRFGVPHGREGLRIVDGAPVPLAVDERVAEGEGLRHQDHRFVAGRITMRVKLAQHVAHGARGLLVLGARPETELGHRIHDAPLHRLETVPDVRQGSIQNDVHRIVEVRLLGEIAQ